MNHDALFAPLQLGAIRIPNRIVMAPLTRMRAGIGNVPTELNAMYYAQRASAGLIIAEGTAVSHQGQGYPSAPGIYTKGQIQGWRLVTDAVHSRGGFIFLQIAHNGRNSHSSLLPNNALPVAPSAIPPNLPAFTRDFKPVPTEIPRALQTDEIPAIIDSFVQAAVNAIEAGFDGVELQGANSHLIDQFLQDGTNNRTDIYGGPAENRIRFLIEIVDRVSVAIGANRLGVRLSPFGQYGGIHDSNPLHVFRIAINALDERQLAYLHLIEGRGSEIGLTDGLDEEALNNAQLFRANFRGPLLSAAAYTPSSAIQTVAEGKADAIAFGRLFIANPDLVERIRDEVPMNKYDRSTFYGGGEHGYIDYPASAGLPNSSPPRDATLLATPRRSEVTMVGPPSAQQPPPRILKADLVGAWSLKSYVDMIEEGETMQPLGVGPRGLLVYTPNGFMSAQLMRLDNSSFDHDDPIEGVQSNHEENPRGFIGYSGEFRFDEATATVYHIPSVSFAAELVGQQLERQVKLDGNILTLTVVTSRIEGKPIKSILSWERALNTRRSA